MSDKKIETPTATPLTPATSLPAGFSIREVNPDEGVRASQRLKAALAAKVPALPSLGPLAAFTGNFTGSGFNTIFRPESTATPTQFPGAVTTTDAADNVLELNLTTEILSFQGPLGSVPNRGTGTQADVFLNGVPYLQAVTDVTVPTDPTPIHLEPGLWVIVPLTTIPAEGTTLVRMASIPHGATINAQGTASGATAGPPTIPAIDITPFVIRSQPPQRIPFQSQDVANAGTRRIPQNLASLVTAGTITQAMLTDPNTVLRNHIVGQSIVSAITIDVFTTAASLTALPAFGGGSDNIAFLLGNAPATTPNAQAVQMTATFWIETVRHNIVVPPSAAGAHLTISAPSGPGVPAVAFDVTPPTASTTPRTIEVTSTQIQYSQTVFLNFAGLTWPHVSVATLVPVAAVEVLDFKLIP